MAKRLSEKQKEEITKSFSHGKSVQVLSEEFCCTKLTIIRNLKKNLGEQKYKKLIEQNKLSIPNSENSNFNICFDKKNDPKKNIFHENQFKERTNKDNAEEIIQGTEFIELTPLNYEIEKSPRKDLSSIPISDMNFPKVVFMVVDKKIELETKYLKDYPDWQFLSEDELNRKTIEIHIDLNIAKRFCNREQKVIKVPNTNVFKIVAPMLISRGITRIVSADNLISL